MKKIISTTLMAMSMMVFTVNAVASDGASEPTEKCGSGKCGTGKCGSGK